MIFMKGLLGLLVLITTCHAISYSMDFEPNERVCFYEVFEFNQKYSFSVNTRQGRQHEVEVSHIDGRQWKPVFFKKSQTYETSTRVDKLASVATTYSFCLKNIDSYKETFKVSFLTGIEVMELHQLPSANDAENLERELNWLEQQAVTLGTHSSNIQGLRLVNQELVGMVGTKLMVFGMIGLATIAVANFIFYRSLKKTFKDRKLI